MSILVKNRPPSNVASSIKNDCASGSAHLVSSVLVSVTLTTVLASYCASDVILAFLTEIIVSCVVCSIPDDVNSASPLLSDTPDTRLFVLESVNLNSLVPVLNF